MVHLDGLFVMKWNVEFVSHKKVDVTYSSRKKRKKKESEKEKSWLALLVLSLEPLVGFRALDNEISPFQEGNGVPLLNMGFICHLFLAIEFNNIFLS